MINGKHNGLMAGKRGLIIGVTNESSLGFGIARAVVAQGASLVLSYPSEAIKNRLSSLNPSDVGTPLLFPCDVNHDEAIATLFESIKKTWSTLDFVVYAAAYAPKEALRGKYVQTSRQDFLNTMAVSCYPFTLVSRYAADFMPEGGSLLTLSYYGAEKVIPHYNVMGVAKAALEASVRYLAADLGPQGIRVNSLSAGPLKTLSASAIGDFGYIMKWNQYNAPLRRNVKLDEVGHSGLYLLSHLSSGVTGENHYVDAGYQVVGMKAPDAPDINAV